MATTRTTRLVRRIAFALPPCHRMQRTLPPRPFTHGWLDYATADSPRGTARISFMYNRSRNRHEGAAARKSSAVAEIHRRRNFSVAILLGFVRAFGLDADICRLLLAEFGQSCADLGEVKPRHFLVEGLRQHID